jgi:hypothetical protein
MSSGKITDSETIRRLNALAVAADGPAGSDEAMEDLDDDEEQIGIVTASLPNGQALVSWMLKMREREPRFIVHIAARSEDLLSLEDTEVEDEEAERVVEAARDYLGEAAFEAQALQEIRSLTREPTPLAEGADEGVVNVGNEAYLSMTDGDPAGHERTSGFASYALERLVELAAKGDPRKVYLTVSAMENGAQRLLLSAAVSELADVGWRPEWKDEDELSEPYEGGDEPENDH